MRRSLLPLILTLILTGIPAFSMMKQRFGGNIKVAEELIGANSGAPLYEIQEDQTRSLAPLSLQRAEGSATIDLSTFDNERFADTQKWIDSLKDVSNSCHWVLDYPYYDHEHPTTISVEDAKLKIISSDESALDVVLSSPCLLPAGINLLNAFTRTQFGYEANEHCLAGRPFLDSISPVSVDPANPYLSLKLNDVDVAPVPEDRFNQISADPDLNLIEGAQYYVYLITSGLSEAQMDHIIASMDIQEIGRAVLNDHVEVQVSARELKAGAKLPALAFVYPAENPYRLLAERLRIEWESAGIKFLPQGAGGSSVPSVRLSVQRMDSNSMDAFRYQLLKAEFSPAGGQSWFDLWDQLESSGKLVPLVIHKSRLAVRKNIQDLRVAADGRPDFAGCWLLP